MNLISLPGFNMIFWLFGSSLLFWATLYIVNSVGLQASYWMRRALIHAVHIDRISVIKNVADIACVCALLRRPLLIHSWRQTNQQIMSNNCNGRTSNDLLRVAISVVRSHPQPVSSLPTASLYFNHALICIHISDEYIVYHWLLPFPYCRVPRTVCSCHLSIYTRTYGPAQSYAILTTFCDFADDTQVLVVITAKTTVLFAAVKITPMMQRHLPFCMCSLFILCLFRSYYIKTAKWVTKLPSAFKIFTCEYDWFQLP